MTIMKHFVRLMLAASLLALFLTLPMLACTDGSTSEETTAVSTESTTAPATQPESEEPTEEPTEEPSAEPVTEELTEPETEAPLPTEVDLPEAYETADMVYDCDDDSLLHTFRNKTAEDFAAVCAYYTEQGFKVYSSTDMGENHAATFVGNGPMAHVYWFKNTGELNIVLSSTAADTLPPATPAVTDGDYECSVWQLMDAEHEYGMCYIVQLKDGSYIIIDSSYSEKAEVICQYLADNYKGEGKPTVRAWLLSHSHNDHYPGFQTFCHTLADSATVEHVLIAPLNDETFDLDDEQGYLCHEVHDDIARLGGAKTVYLHTGMEFSFCDLKLEVLLSPDDIYKTRTSIDGFNNTSIVARLYDNSYSALFLTDVMAPGASFMVNAYGDYLKSDMCQVAHHGVEDVPLSFYEVVRAPLLFYPCDIRYYDMKQRNHHVREALEKKDYTKEILIAGLGEYKRAWGTTYDEDAELIIWDHPTKGPHA